MKNLNKEEYEPYQDSELEELLEDICSKESDYNDDIAELNPERYLPFEYRIDKSKEW
jgi:hypothetical protein